MKKIALILLSVMFLGGSAAATGDFDYDGYENPVSTISIIANGSSIRVTGANGLQLEVFNLTGTKVTSFRLDSNDKTLTLNLAKGCYILKVEKVVRKISIR